MKKIREIITESDHQDIESGYLNQIDSADKNEIMRLNLGKNSGFKELLNEFPNPFMIYTKNKGFVEAWASASYPSNKRYAIVQSYVSRPARGKGLAKTLAEEAFKHMKNKGIHNAAAFYQTPAALAFFKSIIPAAKSSGLNSYLVVPNNGMNWKQNIVAVNLIDEDPGLFFSDAIFRLFHDVYGYVS